MVQRRPQSYKNHPGNARNQPNHKAQGHHGGHIFQQDQVETLNGGFSNVGTMKVRLDPSVILTLLGAHTRISKLNPVGFIVGSLIGAPLDGIMHISHCFIDAIDHKSKVENKSVQLSLDGSIHRSLYDMQKPLFLPGSQFVGCMATTCDVNVFNQLHLWITCTRTLSKWNATKQLTQPIFISLDPNMVHDKLEVMVFQKGLTGSIFTECPTVLFLQNNERNAMKLILGNMPKDKFIINRRRITDTDKENEESRSGTDLRKAIESYIEALQICQNHVEKTIEGEESMNISVIRGLMESLSFETLLEEVFTKQAHETETQRLLNAANVARLTDVQFKIQKLCKLGNF